MSDDYSDMSDFKVPRPKCLLDYGKCTCGGVVYGKMQGDVIVPLVTDTGRQIKHCHECDAKLYPPASQLRLREVSELAAQEERIRKEYNIPCHFNYKEWLIENHGKRVTVGSETKTVVNIYEKRWNE